MKKEKYVVKHKASDMYLTDGYYKSLRNRSLFLSDAHLFSAFELKLASCTLLRNKDKYIVYKYKQLKDNENILEKE
jgi:hypothetical protein